MISLIKVIHIFLAILMKFNGIIVADFEVMLPTQLVVV